MKRAGAFAMVAIVSIFLPRASAVQADVGAIVARGTAGDLHWTLFAESPGLVSGEAEIGLLLQSLQASRHASVAESGGRPGLEPGAVILGRGVRIRATAPDGSAQVRLARPGFAGNRMIYGAPVFFHQTGDWRFRVEVERAGSEPLRFEVVLLVTAGPSPWLRVWPWLAFPAVVVLLYSLVARPGYASRPTRTQST
jgi:hypothetical protein